MTVNQIAYWTLQETKRSNTAREAETERSNKAKEAETYRSNLARETEDHRANLAKELELNRSNLAREAEEHRSNVADETERHRSNLVTEAEEERSNRAKEALEARKLTETERSNKQNEAIKIVGNEISSRQADAAEEQAAAATSRAEQAWWGDWSPYIKAAGAVDGITNGFELFERRGDPKISIAQDIKDMQKNAALASIDGTMIPEVITGDFYTGEVTGTYWKDGQLVYKDKYGNIYPTN